MEEACECICCQDNCPCVDPEFNPDANHPCAACELGEED